MDCDPDDESSNEQAGDTRNLVMHGPYRMIPTRAPLTGSETSNESPPHALTVTKGGSAQFEAGWLPKSERRDHAGNAPDAI